MHDLMRTTLCLLATSLVLLPGASAQGPTIDIASHVDVDVDVKIDDVASAAHNAVDRAQNAAATLEAKASARVQEATDGIEAEAKAQADAGENAAQRALAGITAALEALGAFASGLFARVDLSAKLG